MSQHLIDIKKDNILYSIQSGWDKPLGQFYLVVIDDTNGDEVLLYSNIDDQKAFGTGVEFSYFENVLNSFSITLPKKMVEAINQDRGDNAVNRVVEYDSINLDEE